MGDKVKINKNAEMRVIKLISESDHDEREREQRMIS